MRIIPDRSGGSPEVRPVLGRSRFSILVLTRGGHFLTMERDSVSGAATRLSVGQPLGLLSVLLVPK